MVFFILFFAEEARDPGVRLGPDRLDVDGVDGVVVVVEEGVDAVEGGEELLVSKAFSILLILLDMAPITCSMRDICDKIADDAAVLPLPPPPPPPPLLLLLLLLFKSASGILTLSSGILYFSAAT